MTDIYVRSPNSSNRKAIWIAVGVVAVIAFAIWLFLAPSPVSTSNEDEATEIVQVDEAITTPEPEAMRQEQNTPVRHTINAGGGERPSRPGTGLQDLTQAKTLLASGNLLEAREAAYQVFESSGDERTLDSARKLLSEINTTLTFSQRQMPEKIDYVIQRGDSLARIAKKFNTTVELIQKSNNLKGSLIRGGDRLRILQGELSLTVDKSDNILDVFLNGKFFKRYDVGTGEFSKTPVGDFEINDRIAQPTWWRPDGKAIPFGDPENLLGTHWLSLNVRGYGIHGTWEPETIGHQASAGCVRLLNEDIEELFALVPLGTPVKITD